MERGVPRGGDDRPRQRVNESVNDGSISDRGKRSVDSRARQSKGGHPLGVDKDRSEGMMDGEKNIWPR